MGTVCSLGCSGIDEVEGSCCLAGPVFVMGTILSPAFGGGRLGAVIVRTPSEDSVLTRSCTS